MSRSLSMILLFVLAFSSPASGEEAAFPFFDYITGDRPAKMIGYTPLGLDPRNPANQVNHKTSELREDLRVLRQTFDGLVLYGYNESTTPRIVELARELNYRAVLLGVWQVKSTEELDGVAREITLHKEHLALGVLIGNEGVLFERYEKDDLTLARRRLERLLPESIPLATSEPHVSYHDEFFLSFGDFLAPNIHPVFDARDLSATDAARWARERAREMATRSGRPVLLKETGFPHAGEAKYTPDSQRAFWEAYLERGLLIQHDGLWVSHAVGFEAFDLPWKSEASGLEIEKSWGLFDMNRKRYPAVEIWENTRR